MHSITYTSKKTSDDILLRTQQKMLLCSLVLSQLDYLNSVLTDLPKATLRSYNYTQR